MKLKDFPELLLQTSKVKDENMSFFVGEKGALKNRGKFIKKTGLDFDKLIVLYLQHKEKVYLATNKDLGKGGTEKRTAIKADALITNKKNVNLFLLTADCLPIAVYDPKNKVIGLIHASRHNIRKIINNTIKKMEKDFGTNPKDLVVNIGPSIGPCHYEIDLWKIAGEELEKFGVSENQIENPRICTFESAEYFSHRESKAKNISDNRFATIFGMK